MFGCIRTLRGASSISLGVIVLAFLEFVQVKQMSFLVHNHLSMNFFECCFFNIDFLFLLVNLLSKPVNILANILDILIL